MKTAVQLGVCLLILAQPLGAGDGNKSLDPAKLVGTWKYVSGEKAGEKVDLDRIKGQTVTITKDTWTLQGDDTFVMKYTVDASKKPAAIKLEMTESPFGAGAKAVGIIEVSGDDLKICYSPMGEEPPKTFATKDTKAHLFVLKRGK